MAERQRKGGGGGETIQAGRYEREQILEDGRMDERTDGGEDESRPEGAFEKPQQL